MSPAICRIARGTAVVPLLGSPGSRHLARCLRCQASGVRSRAARRGFDALREHVVPAPAGLHAAVMAGLGSQDAVDPRRRLTVMLRARQAAAAAAVGAAVAVAAGGFVRRRSRLVS